MTEIIRHVKFSFFHIHVEDLLYPSSTDKLDLVKIHKGGLVLGSSQCPLLPQLPQKNDTRFKKGQNRLENNNLASLVSHTLCTIDSIVPIRITQHRMEMENIGSDIGIGLGS